MVVTTVDIFAGAMCLIYVILWGAYIYISRLPNEVRVEEQLKINGYGEIP